MPRPRIGPESCASVFWWDVVPSAEEFVEAEPAGDIRRGYLQLSSCCVGLCLATLEDHDRSPSDAYRGAVLGVAARAAAVYAQLYLSWNTADVVRSRAEAYEALTITLEDVPAHRFRHAERLPLAARIVRLMTEAGEAGRSAQARPEDGESYESFLDRIYDVCIESVAMLAACEADALPGVRR